ncbi:hypothetical protein Y1Q_0007825 [Alligator mississippiensis]|uniref:Uncharacterized protein n=1 Tax=Alligator mississippiensis TaxID=8496 RepID=A0A151N749_ALLMI|nr:hypothetical protein Y1Q_0007825 [Alligator mississippiensis]
MDPERVQATRQDSQVKESTAVSKMGSAEVQNIALLTGNLTCLQPRRCRLKPGQLNVQAVSEELKRLVAWGCFYNRFDR